MPSKIQRPGAHGGILPQTEPPSGSPEFIDGAKRMKGPWGILMVEDSATDAALAMRAFKHEKIANPVRVVTSGEAGLEFLFGPDGQSKGGSHWPHLILLDLNLPGISGIEFLRRIKGDERTRDIPVVVLSLSEGDRNIMACVRLGSDGYIIKPLDIDNLVRVTAKLKLRLTLTPPDAGKTARDV